MTEFCPKPCFESSYVTGWTRNLLSEGIEPNPGPMIINEETFVNVLKDELGISQLKESMRTMVVQFLDLSKVAEEYSYLKATEIIDTTEINDQIPNFKYYKTAFKAALNRIEQNLPTNIHLQEGIRAVPQEFKTEEEYATELYAPFPSTPLTCVEVDRLKDLLLAPPLRKLPLPIDLDITTTQSVLFERRSAKTPFMAIQFYHALNRCLPPADSSEISWEGFYDCFIQETLQSNYSLLRGFTINRDVEDDSLSIDQKRRDLNVWYESTLIFCGEDKRLPTEINEAISDLRVKNKGSNRACYGDLDYILSFATAGPIIQFFALPIKPKAAPIPISKQYNVGNSADRVSVMTSIINVHRWCLSIKGQLTPLPGKVHTIRKAMSPFINDDQECTMEFHHNYVSKSYKLPRDHYANILKIYSLLNEGKLKNCVKLKRLLFGQTEILSFSTKNLKAKHYQVTVELYPIGQRRKPETITELKIAIRCVLEFLVDLHFHNYVHRDLRWPNVLRSADGSWFVIDLETAGPNNEYVFWNPASGTMPEPVRSKQKEYTFKTDLYQVANLISQSFETDSEVLSFSSKLKNAYNSAEEALADPFLIN